MASPLSRSAARAILRTRSVAAGSSSSSSSGGGGGGAGASSSSTTRWTSSSAISAAPSASTSTSASTASSKQGGKTSEERASAARSSKWTPALAPGVEPAYDAALAFLRSHRDTKLAEAAALQSAFDETGVAAARASVEEDVPGRRLRRALEDVQVEALVDDPETRWRFANGDVDLSQPVFRFLREQSWRKNGALDRLLERVRLMKVVPDVLPTIAPTVDVQLAFGEGRGISDHGGDGGDIWPGVFMPTAKSLEAPQVTVTPFHTDERKYTLLLVDPDVPDELSMSYSTFVHWHLTDIPLSATQTAVSTASAKTVQSYIPPHPQKGSRYHRYTTILFEQTSASFNSSPGEQALPGQEQQQQGAVGLPSRSLVPGSILAYAQANGLKPVGVHFFRQECNRENERAVEQVYRTILKTEAPAYGNMPAQDPYRDAAGFRRSRYFSSADELALGASGSNAQL
ncbi:mitochondrial 54S ribosomal protein YmL35 [Tilletia horrida]|uniref:Mitochondrial 54S ribosomal protein YmL35 n=1 Tax=Tilletia horrida TaxID=155126 RepID=A0AAN6G849_9BASI|nr:mitochondrial 54S ribosomal protein YmL35 [Tilletia horrida]